MGKWIQGTFSTFPRSLPNGNRKLKLSGLRLKFRDRFKGKGHKYRTSDFGRVNGKGIDEIGISILVFLEGILPLKIRSEKIRLTFIEDKTKKKLDGGWNEMACGSHIRIEGWEYFHDTFETKDSRRYKHDTWIVKEQHTTLVLAMLLKKGTSCRCATKVAPLPHAAIHFPHRRRYHKISSLPLRKVDGSVSTKRDTLRSTMKVNYDLQLVKSQSDNHEYYKVLHKRHRITVLEWDLAEYRRISYEEFLGDSPKQTSAKNSQIVSSGKGNIDYLTDATKALRRDDPMYGMQTT
ncbi:hypothetical protein CK203_105766 [Vitis vinifera]|uniref:Uncharacterized protein n=1 Tax=Vitis vinifera TaxID=29760 RepID=A0A438D2K6_VITVI|nr:hypothetical protein CK203_105766 [Vitis vinifera]